MSVWASKSWKSNRAWLRRQRLSRRWWGYQTSINSRKNRNMREYKLRRSNKNYYRARSKNLMRHNLKWGHFHWRNRREAPSICQALRNLESHRRIGILICLAEVLTTQMWAPASIMIGKQSLIRDRSTAHHLPKSIRQKTKTVSWVSQITKIKKPRICWLCPDLR